MVGVALTELRTTAGASGESFNATSVTMMEGSAVRLQITTTAVEVFNLTGALTVSGSLIGCVNQLQTCQTAVGTSTCTIWCVPRGVGSGSLTVTGPDGSGGTWSVTVTQTVLSSPRE